MTAFPDGKSIPKEMQLMVDKGLVEITNVGLYNQIIAYLNKKHLHPDFEERGYELYFIPLPNPITLIYEDSTETLWATKDSNVMQLTPSHYR